MVTTSESCAAQQDASPCAPQPAAADAPLCGHTPEQFAEAALMLEPRGAAWSRLYGTVKAALHRAFGLLLSRFDQRLCDLLREATACQAVELLSEWEREYGLPGACQPNYPSDIAARQALVCAARRGQTIRTLTELQAHLRTVLDCPGLTLTLVTTGPNPGICVGGYAAATCPKWWHATVGGWTGGVGKPLTQGDAKWQLMACLLRKYLPAHVAWSICT